MSETTTEIPVKQIVEAALLAAGQPLALPQLAALFPEDQPPPAGAIERALHELAEDCAARGVALVEVASGFRFQVREEFSPWVSQLWTERQTRYSRALLETLALIAYRQPITRGEIEQIRGVAVSSNIIRTLEERDWVRVVGHRDVPGKPALYGTTRGFLDYFGLKSLDQLPPLSELREIPELEPQLPFDAAAGDAPRAAQLPDQSGDASDGVIDEAIAHDVPEATAAGDDAAADPSHDDLEATEADPVESHHDDARLADQGDAVTDPTDASEADAVDPRTALAEGEAAAPGSHESKA